MTLTLSKSEVLIFINTYNKFLKKGAQIEIIECVCEKYFYRAKSAN